MTTRRRRTEPPEGMAPMLDQCRHCGDFFEPAESGLAGVCPTCESERYSTCPECRQVRANREFITLEGGRTICRTCANTIARRCDECGRWHLIDEVGHITDRHGNHICERCQDGWSRCERCGEWVPDNETRESAGRRVCFRCAADEAHEGVQSYYYKPRPVFHRADGEPADGLLLGVELEMDHGDGDAAAARIIQEFGSDWLYFKRDGSLDDGVELVTHPISPSVMMSEETREMWARISEVALEEGLRSHDTRTCGLHVHVNRDYFGKGALAQEMAELEAYLVERELMTPKEALKCA